MKSWFFAVIFFIGVILAIPLNLANDLDGNLFQILYLKQHFSLWNPQLHQGIPTMGDPINFFWHPLASLIFFLPVEISVRLIFIICWVATFVFSYFLFRHLKIKKDLALWLGLTYAGSSYYLARIIAGHLEKVLSYPLIPLFLLAIARLGQKPSIKTSGIMAIAFYLLLSSTDMYNFFYLCVGYAIYLIFCKKAQIPYFLLALILAMLFGAVRWIPMLPVLGHLFKISDPYSGSQNLVSLLLQITLPKAALLSAIVPSNYGWWEKTALIGPLFLLVLLAFKNRPKILFIVFAVVAITISMPASIFSPWHWLLLLPQFTMFHVPTRVFAVLTLCVLAITAPVLANWPKWGVRLVQINLLLLAVFWLFIFKYRMFPAVDSRYAGLEKYPHQVNASILYPAFDKPVLERAWQNDWQLFATTHGTYIQGSGAADWLAYQVQEKPYTNKIPDYMIWPDDKLLPFSGTPLASESGITLYKTAGTISANSKARFNLRSYYLGAAVSLLSMSLWAIKNYS